MTDQEDRAAAINAGLPIPDETIAVIEKALREGGNGTFTWETRTVVALIARVRADQARIAELEAALKTAESWVNRWTAHVGSCKTDTLCTCGRTFVLFEARRALEEKK